MAEDRSDASLGDGDRWLGDVYRPTTSWAAVGKRKLASFLFSISAGRGKNDGPSGDVVPGANHRRSDYRRRICRPI